MIGGPSDVVVENDVKKNRIAPTVSAPPAEKQAPAIIPAAKSEPVSTVKAEPLPVPKAEPAPTAPLVISPVIGSAPSASAETPALVAAKPAEAPPLPPVSEASKTPSTAPAPVRPTLAAVPTPTVSPASRNGSGAPLSDTNGTQAKPNGRREPLLAPPEPSPASTVVASTTPAVRPPKPAAVSTKAADKPPEKRDEPVVSQPAAKRAKPVGSSVEATPTPPMSLPLASTPWPEGETIENEVVRALRNERQAVVAAPEPPARKKAAPPPPAARATDPGTTLGDLADRLEEALAREVREVRDGDASRGRGRLELGLDAYVAPSAPRPQGGNSTKDTPRSRDTRAEPRVDADSRREPRIAAERQEEAPVINLNARRREAVDPLEDEMARLLGELTGDSTRR